jgi:hypothetical protein
MLQHATYAQITEYVHEYHGYKIGGNCIAEAKEKVGLQPRMANNRKDPTERVTACRAEILEAIYEAFRYFKMID